MVHCTETTISSLCELKVSVAGTADCNHPLVKYSPCQRSSPDPCSWWCTAFQRRCKLLDHRQSCVRALSRIQRRNKRTPVGESVWIRIVVTGLKFAHTHCRFESISQSEKFAHCRSESTSQSEKFVRYWFESSIQWDKLPHCRSELLNQSETFVRCWFETNQPITITQIHAVLIWINHPITEVRALSISINQKFVHLSIWINQPIIEC